MKRLMIVFSLVSLLVSCGSDESQSSLSGRPEQDPIVRKLRNAFAGTDSVLAMSSLQPGVAWNCTEFSAMKDDFSRIETIYYSFTDRGLFVKNEGTRPVDTFILEKQHLTGSATVDNVRVTEYVRATPEGDLIIEIVKRLNIENHWLQAISDSTRGAYAYLHCPIGQVIP